jgi:hypothetical protein
MLPELPEARMETRKPIEVPPKISKPNSLTRQRREFLG